jgi:hypothetical protein
MLRAVALLSVFAGIALGATSNDLPARPAMTYGGYAVLAADFHVHSFPDGLPSWEVVREARRRGLEAIALTSHNSLRGWRMWTGAPWTPSETRGVIVLPGEELTSAGYHATIVGLATAIPWRQPVAAAVAAAHAQGAIAILAHPTGNSLRRVLDDDGLRSLDGIEVAFSGVELSRDKKKQSADVYRRAVAMHPGSAAIGSSDFHYFAPIGFCRTFVFAREATPDGILEAVRAGRTAACDGLGATHGPADLASAVAGRCREAAGAPPEGDTTASRAGTVLALAGLAALVLLGPSRS